MSHINNFAIAEHHSIKSCETFLTSETLWTENTKKFNVFKFFLRIKSALQYYWLHFIHQGISRHFSALRKHLIAKQCIQLLTTETWWVKLARNWILVWFVIFKLGFPHSNCQYFLRQGLNQQFCFATKWFIIYIFSFHLFLEYLIGLNCQKLWMCVVQHCVRISFIHSYRLHFFIKASIDFEFWIVKTFFFALGGNSVVWIFQNLHMHVVLVKIPTQLSPELPAGLLPPKSQWSIISAYKVTR